LLLRFFVPPKELHSFPIALENTFEFLSGLPSQTIRTAFPDEEICGLSVLPLLLRIFVIPKLAHYSYLL
jgi:hypothetical protein